MPERKRERDDKNKKQNCGGGREIDGRGDNEWKEVNIKRFILCGHRKKTKYTPLTKFNHREIIRLFILLFLHPTFFKIPLP